MYSYNCDTCLGKDSLKRTPFNHELKQTFFINEFAMKQMS